MAAAEMYKLFAEATKANESIARYYGIAIGVLIGLFTVVHWAQFFFVSGALRSSAISKAWRAVSRPVRRTTTGITFGGMLLLPGRVVLALVYFAINLALTFVNVNWTMQTLFAKRLGWQVEAMTLLNLVLVVFLGLKNTPLSPLAGRSYENLNVLHRCCGYTTILFMVLHAIIYVTGLAKADALHVMRMAHQYAGAAAGIAMLIILVSAIEIVRKRQYEVFYVVHIVMVAVILATAGFHVYDPPDISLATMIMIGLTSALWVVDRVLRFSRWIYYGLGNYCTLTPLPEGATRVTLRRSIKARPGSHVFLWIPGVRTSQTHPFTLVANKPAEFVIAAQDGFTRALYEIACAKPGLQFRAAMEGAYGQVPNPRQYDKLVLIAGGSGATFTLALALDWARNIRLRKHKSTLEFIWTVKTRDYLHWFADELAKLQATKGVSLQIHITGSKRESGDSTPSSNLVASPVFSDKEKLEPSIWSLTNTESSITTDRSIHFAHGRPHMGAVIERAIGRMPSTKRILFAASGPAAMMADARAIVSAQMIPGLPELQLHLEEFEW